MNHTKFLFVYLLATVTASAKNSVIITEGSGKLLLNPEKTATFTFDYADCYVGEISKSTLKEGAIHLQEYLTSQGKDAAKEWEETQQFCYEQMVKSWNKMNRKRTTLVPPSEKHDYEIIFHVKALDKGNTAASIFGMGNAGHMTIMGDIDVIDAETKEKIISYQVNEIESKSGYTEAQRLWNAYFYVVEEMCQVNRKSK